MATRKTRGPRTPSERACDAARKAATILEDAPPGDDRDDYLEPVGVLLRMIYGSMSERRQADAEQALRGLIARLHSPWRYFHPEIERIDGATNDEVLDLFRSVVTEIQHRLANYEDALDEVPEAAAEGFIIGSKAMNIWHHDHVTHDPFGSVSWRTGRLEKEMIRRG